MGSARPQVENRPDFSAVPGGHAVQYRAAAGKFPAATENRIGADAPALQRRELALMERGEDDGAVAIAAGVHGQPALRLDLVAAAEGLMMMMRCA